MLKEKCTQKKNEPLAFSKKKKKNEALVVSPKIGDSSHFSNNGAIEPSSKICPLQEKNLCLIRNATKTSWNCLVSMGFGRLNHYHVFANKLMSFHKQIRVGYHVSPSSLIICMHCVLSLYFISLIMASAFLANWPHMMCVAYCNYSNFMSVGRCACKVHFISSICFHFLHFSYKKKACDWMNHAVANSCALWDVEGCYLHTWICLLPQTIQST